MNRILFIVIILFLGCTHDKVGEIECIPLEFPVEISQEKFFQTQLPTASHPCFNPNDPEEIVCIIGDGLDTAKMYKVNLRNPEEKEFFFKGVIASRIRWSKKDWLVFGLNDNNIYKMKSNGDSLTNITTSGNSFGPEWNKEGDQIIYKIGSTYPPLGVITDDNDVVLDSIEGGFYSPSWQNDTFIVHTDVDKIFLANTYTKEIEVIHEITDEPGISGGAEWLNDNEFIWTYRKGIFKTNIRSKVTTIILEMCDSKIYLGPSYSKQTNMLIFERMDREIEPNGSWRSYRNIYSMDTDGDDVEQVVF